MPEFWFWGLLASIVLLAIGASLKAVEFRFELKLTNQVIDRLWKEIGILNKRNNQRIPDEQKLNIRGEQKFTENSNHKDYPLHEILTAIAKYHSQEIPATPKLIATDIGLDPEITLAYMWKYHNDQYISFRSGGSKPGINTPFFLTPKALEQIEITVKEQIT